MSSHQQFEPPGAPPDAAPPRSRAEAIREVVRAAWMLCENTEESGEIAAPEFRVMGDDFRALMAALDVAEALIPVLEQPANAAYLVTLLAEDARRHDVRLMTTYQLRQLAKAREGQR